MSVVLDWWLDVCLEFQHFKPLKLEPSRSYASLNAVVVALNRPAKVQRILLLFQGVGLGSRGLSGPLRERGASGVHHSMTSRYQKNC